MPTEGKGCLGPDCLLPLWLQTALGFAFDYKVPFAFGYKLPGFYHCELLYISQNALENAEGRVKRKRYEHTFPYHTFAVERQTGY